MIRLKPLLLLLITATSVFISCKTQKLPVTKDYPDINSIKTDGYYIRVRAKGMRDTSVYLAYHFGKNKLLKDTAQFDSNGVAIIEGNKKLGAGIYIVVLPTGLGNRLVETIIGDDQVYELSFDTIDVVESMKVSSSHENTLYYDHLRFDTPLRIRMEEINKAYAAESDKDKKAELKKELQTLNDSSLAYRQNVIDSNPTYTLAKLFRATQDVEVPEAPILANGRPDSTFRFRYYREHYFDNIDFSTDMILRTPIYRGKLDYWLDKLNYQIPDSLIEAVDFIADKVKGDSALFRYTMVTISNKFEKSKKMGTDAILVHIFKKYYLSGMAWWTSPETDKKIKEYVILHSYNQIGMKAPNMFMRDTLGHFKEMYKVDADMTMLFFWSATCGHCKRATPVLQKIRERYHPLGFEVYAVCIDKELLAYERFLRKHKTEWINVSDTANVNNFRTYYNVRSTPTTYLLDKDKIVRYKRFDMHSLETILRDHYKIKEDEEWLTTEESGH